jgi:heat shock protein HtpX
MFTIAKRVFLFLLTNMAVMLLLTGVLFVVEVFFPGITTATGGIYGTAIIALVFGFWGAFISLFISRWSAKRAYSIELITSENLSSQTDKVKLVYNIVDRLAKQNHITMPEVWVYESADPNAFATGATKNSSLVAVSTWLLDAMTPSEIEWVVGHEMAHILNGDMVTMTLLQGVLNTFVIFLARIVWGIIDSTVFKNEEWERGIWYFITVMILEIIFWILASLVTSAFSRHREFRADEGSAKFVGKAKMIAGLKKLQSLMPVTVRADDGNLATMKISAKDAFILFASHPPLEARIKSLEENYQLP